jgi:hypothetical protein
VETGDLEAALATIDPSSVMRSASVWPGRSESVHNVTLVLGRPSLADGWLAVTSRRPGPRSADV